jgi:hypothetical protein
MACMKIYIVHLADFGKEPHWHQSFDNRADAIIKAAAFLSARPGIAVTVTEHEFDYEEGTLVLDSCGYKDD